MISGAASGLNSSVYRARCFVFPAHLALSLCVFSASAKETVSPEQAHDFGLTANRRRRFDVKVTVKPKHLKLGMPEPVYPGATKSDRTVRTSLGRTRKWRPCTNPSIAAQSCQTAVRRTPLAGAPARHYRHSANSRHRHTTSAQEGRMAKMLKFWCVFLSAALGFMSQPSVAAEGTQGVQGRLASVGWLKANLARSDVVVIDASPSQLHQQQHIPGAIHSDLFTFGPKDLSIAQIEERLRSWGVSPGQQVILYDQGGTYMATRLFWDLVHHGFPPESLLILDGGMSKWLSTGGEVTKAATPTPRPGTIRMTTLNQDVRVRLPEFLAASGDPRNNVLLEALEPSYFFGGAAFFNRAGHVPQATLMPSTDFYNPDKTFKSPQEIRRMLDHLGIKPEQQVLTYCGGGGAAAVPFFALKYMLNYPHVKLFQESQMGWLQDERELPVWTYAAPHLTRDTPWLKAWGSPMLRAFGLSQVSIVDVRAADVFNLGHVPLAVNIPAQSFKSHLRNPEALAALLGQAGVDRSHEAVVVSDGGLNESSALALLMLESLGQHKVSVFMDSIERWTELGHEVARPAASAAPGKPPERSSTRALPYAANRRADMLVTGPLRTQGLYPKVYVASGQQLPARTPEGRVFHLPYARFLNADGTPKAAKDIWNMLAQAGVPRYAEVVVFADGPGEAAVNYVIFRLMGFPDVKVWAP
ncbi:MAG: rhodanese-like domain-containing protein [Rubrivivax sp.]|nr:rhodanese-like domain-containing protein [Rubrivivax sp.]